MDNCLIDEVLLHYKYRNGCCYSALLIPPPFFFEISFAPSTPFPSLLLPLSFPLYCFYRSPLPWRLCEEFYYYFAHSPVSPRATCVAHHHHPSPALIPLVVVCCGDSFVVVEARPILQLSPASPQQQKIKGKGQNVEGGFIHVVYGERQTRLSIGVYVGTWARKSEQKEEN
jgi:hypothetical protein